MAANGANGPFEILEILGEGSFGTVCVARVTNDALKRKVALKMLKGAYVTNRKILNRTRDEARLLSKIHHPNIVRVERLIEINGRPVIVMEHVQGPSLDQLLLRFRDGLPPSIALDLIRQTALALHAAYTTIGDGDKPMKVIHRDIKPSNILLSVHGEVKVVDFGIARGDFEGKEAETESVVMGSRPYMAPERLDGMSDSPSVDVYSAGMSLYELLTGRTMSLSINPVAHDQAMSRQLAYVQVPGMTVQAVEDLRDLIRRMCSYDRTKRPSALQAVRDLEQLSYLIEPRFRTSLVDFARSAVVPIYESRPKVSPEQAMDQEGDDEFLREVTGQVTRTETAEARPSWMPVVFVAAVATMVVLAGSLALWKMLSMGADSDGHVQISMWIPTNSHARIGGQLLVAPGKLRVPPGPSVVEIDHLTSGRTVQCRFVAEQGAAVRFVVDGDRESLTTNDVLGVPCVDTASSRIVPQGRGVDASGT